MFNYDIGGQERKIEVSEGIADIPQNRTLLIEKFTDESPLSPQIIPDLKSVRTTDPKTQHWVASGPGGVENLRIRDLPLPEPGPGQVRIRVLAFGINRSGQSLAELALIEVGARHSLAGRYLRHRLLLSRGGRLVTCGRAIERLYR